ncbi:MAG TPA: DedA family protein [Roseiflexaceae bacterium]|nr:DedA family protein [Roseiflexaceae bacterium]
MSELIDRLSDSIRDMIAAMGYPGIALVMLLENLVPPIPSELVMPFAGFLVAEGRLRFAGVVAAGTAGAVLGALVLYGVGMRAGEPLVRRMVRRYGRWITVSEHDLDRALATFGRHGDAIVFFGRLVPMVRSLISLPAGMRRMPLGRFLLLTALGSAVWNTALAYAGLTLGQNWETVLSFLSRYQQLTRVLLAALGLLLAGRMAMRWRAQRAEPVIRDIL